MHHGCRGGGFEQGGSLSHRNWAERLAHWVCDAGGPGWNSPRELRKVSRTLGGSSFLATVSLSPQGKCRVQPRTVESIRCCHQQGLPGPKDLVSLPNRLRKQGQFTPIGKTPGLLTAYASHSCCPRGVSSLARVSAGEVGAPREPQPESAGLLSPALVVWATHPQSHGSEERPQLEQSRDRTHPRLLGQLPLLDAGPTSGALARLHPKNHCLESSSDNRKLGVLSPSCLTFPAEAPLGR